jgi:hypothetical protein
MYISPIYYYADLVLNCFIVPALWTHVMSLLVTVEATSNAEESVRNVKKY